MDIEINEVQEIIKNLESSGELSIKEEKYLKIAKLCVQLAAGNVALKEECGGNGSYRNCPACTFSEYIEAPETTVTDRIVAGIKADGVEEFTAYCGEENSVFVEAKAYYRSLPDAAWEFCSMLRENKSEGVKS